MALPHSARRRGLIAVSTGLIAALALSACGAGNTGAGDTGTAFIVGTTDKVVSIDPAGSYDAGSTNVQTQVYSYLMNFAAGSTELSPDAAEKCEFTQPTEYTCTMKEGLKFANGHALTASDVAFSFKRVVDIKDDNGPSSLLGAMKSVEAKDDKTVVFTLNSANDQTFPQILATSAGPIVDEEVYPADKVMSDDEVVTSKGTSGPYTITSYTKNQIAEFTKNPDYNGTYGAAQLETVTMKYYTEESNLKLEIQNKTIDVAYRSLTPTDVENLKTVEGLTVHTGPGGESRYIVFNMNTMPGKDAAQKLAIRKAMASSIDREALATQIYKGTMTPEWSAVPEGQNGANTAFKDLYGEKPDKAKAEKFLTDAGVSIPLAIDLWYNPDHYGKSSAEEYAEVKNQLEATGLFTVNLQSAEWTTYSEDRTKDLYPIYQLGWFPDFPDSDNYLSPFFMPENFVQNHYENPAMTALLDKQRTDPNAESRNATIAEAQNLVAADVPILPLLTGSQVAIAKSDVKGVDTTLDASFKFRFSSLSR